MTRRVVITGLGFSTPLGRHVGEVWTNLLAGRSGIGRIRQFDASAFPVRIAGEVKGLSPNRLMAQFPKASGEDDRKVWLGLDAASGAVADARLTGRCFPGAFLSVGVSLETFFLERVVPRSSVNDPGLLLAQGPLRPDTSGPLQTPLDRLTELLGDHYGIFQGRLTNCSACAAGAQAIGEAFDRVRDGTADLALAGATDSSINPLGLGGFGLLRILSTENDQPEKACRPFDATRQGTVLSEGAVFVVLETWERARRCGIRAYAEVLGYGTSLDAYRVTDPHPTGRGAGLSMAAALRDAGLNPGDIDGINGHGTGTPKNDAVETLAYRRLFGDWAYHIPVTANKSMTGHMIATSGAFEAAAAALTLWDRQIPPTINLAHPDPACDLDYVVDGCRPFAGRTMLSNSFGFGGQNATLIFGKIEP